MSYYDFDYNTSAVSGDEIFDLTTLGGFSGTAIVMTNPKYAREAKGMIGSLVKMSPNQYFDIAAKIFRTSSQAQKDHVLKDDSEEIEELKKVITEKKKRFPLTFINLKDKTQEGRHRMAVAGELFGWDHKFPVLIVQDPNNMKIKQGKFFESFLREGINESCIIKGIIFNTDDKIEDTPDFKSFSDKSGVYRLKNNFYLAFVKIYPGTNSTVYHSDLLRELTNNNIDYLQTYYFAISVINGELDTYDIETNVPDKFYKTILNAAQDFYF